MYISSTYKKDDVHEMYMRRPSVPDPLYEAVEQHAREHDTSWHQALERVLEQKAEIEIPAEATTA
jgi:hypothetical protein